MTALFPTTILPTSLLCRSSGIGSGIRKSPNHYGAVEYGFSDRTKVSLITSYYSSSSHRSYGASVKTLLPRPLRTYSKRAPPADSPEPAPKRQRIGASSPILSTQEAIPEPISDVKIPELSPPDLPPLLPIKKGTITSYFKVIPSAPSSTLNSELSSDAVEPKTTPPSSPPALGVRRKTRRRLTTRIVTCSASEDPQAEVEDEGEGGNGRSDPTEDEPVPPIIQTGTPVLPSPDNLSRIPAKRKTRSDAGKRGRNTGKGTKPVRIQTTLSLSAEEKAFTECKECNMLYNPLHRQDAKCHARRHAAMLKAKSSTRVIKTAN
ncbi:hypothetical protein GGS23DRAFT_516301 [Durotheca rogersii]|uniref:uncharacterized protein n=1 Tax=Durotheca rogersii TaxID=419775 RepID=UPI00221E73F7|nr:uncharacterized protein GGS23DRAFT_516301 [Durotheca rogersii]KAI5863838.1 hypothetical protein GGS23DRAFT_516301 [Durotheca rogersii]